MKRKSRNILIIVTAVIIIASILLIIRYLQGSGTFTRLSGFDGKAAFYAEWNQHGDLILVGTPDNYQGFKVVDRTGWKNLGVGRYEYEKNGYLDGVLVVLTPEQGLFMTPYSNVPGEYRNRSIESLITFLTKNNPRIWSRLGYSYALGPEGSTLLYLPNVPADVNNRYIVEYFQ